jgi:hypothetical protein
MARKEAKDKEMREMTKIGFKILVLFKLKNE